MASRSGKLGGAPAEFWALYLTIISGWILTQCFVSSQASREEPLVQHGFRTETSSS